MPSATLILDWRVESSANQRSLKYVIEPSTIYPGDTVTISIYDPDDYGLMSLYGGLSDKSIATENEAKTELLRIDEQPEFPISELNGVVASLPIIDTEGKSIFKAGGGSLLALMPVVDSQFKPDVQLNGKIGSAKCEYKTYPAQVWKHDGFDAAGQAVLFATNEETLKEELIPLTIYERPESATDTRLAIEGTPITKAYFGLYGVYAKFRVLPAKLSPTVKATVGRVERVGPVVHTVKSESIRLDGSGKASAEFSIKKLLSSTGVFFDSKDKEVTPSFSATQGVLTYTKGAFGDVYVSYETDAIEYDYFADVQIAPDGSSTVEIGKVIAAKDGDSISYEIPAHEANFRDKVEVLSVSYEIAATEKGAFEMPPHISSGDASYPGHGYSGDELMDTTGYAPTEVIIESVMFDGFGLSFNEENDRTMKPFNGRENDTRVYQVRKNIPDWMRSSAVDEVNDAEIKLKQKYGVA